MRKEGQNWKGEGGVGRERGRENSRRRQGERQVQGAKYELEIPRNSVAQGGGRKAGTMREDKIYAPVRLVHTW